MPLSSLAHAMQYRKVISSYSFLLFELLRTLQSHDPMGTNHSVHIPVAFEIFLNCYFNTMLQVSSSAPTPALHPRYTWCGSTPIASGTQQT